MAIVDGRQPRVLQFYHLGDVTLSFFIEMEVFIYLFSSIFFSLSHTHTHTDTHTHTHTHLSCVSLEGDPDEGFPDDLTDLLSSSSLLSPRFLYIPFDLPHFCFQ